jgi:hypothetical protein
MPPHIPHPIFWHGQIVSHQVQISCDIKTHFLVQSVKVFIIAYLLQRLSDKVIQHPLRTVHHFIELFIFLFLTSESLNKPFTRIGN